MNHNHISESWSEADQKASEPDFYGKWFDIDCHKPQVDFEVLVCVDDDVYIDFYREGSVDGEYWFDSEVEEMTHEVTHWMPLPEPPK